MSHAVTDLIIIIGIHACVIILIKFVFVKIVTKP